MSTNDSTEDVDGSDSDDGNSSGNLPEKSDIVNQQEIDNLMRPVEEGAGILNKYEKDSLQSAMIEEIIVNDSGASHAKQPESINQPGNKLSKDEVDRMLAAIRKKNSVGKNKESNEEIEIEIDFSEDEDDSGN